MCCKEGIGACATCAYDGTMAFVRGRDCGGISERQTFIRYCPPLLATDDLGEIGIVTFHELIHMVSLVGDAEVGYGKEDLAVLAYNNPEAARMSANNYSFYVAQNGFSYEAYTRITDAWGMSISDPFCID